MDFNAKQFWIFFGSALIVSVAYMDPGNFGTAISAGSSFNYALLWVVWLSSGIAMLFQYLSGKMGVAGFSLAEVIKIRWKKGHVLLYWLLAEFSILATDVAEFLGIVVALNLLFGVPLLIAAFVSVLDVLLLLLLTRKTFRTMEYAFILFVSVIGIGYIYELFITKPDISPIIIHSVIPVLNQNMILFAVGLIGATVMPHALFVHSWLVKNKARDKKHKINKDKMQRFHLIDTIISLLIAALINAAILIMAAKAFYGSGLQIATISQAYKTLTPLFGTLASIVFAIALLSSGISSSITGTLAGQSIMESLTDFKISPTVRRLITRFINLMPIVVAILLNIDPLTVLVYSQVVLSFLIPLPLIPLIYYSSKREIMHNLTNRKITTYVASAFALIILFLNVYLIYSILV